MTAISARVAKLERRGQIAAMTPEAICEARDACLAGLEPVGPPAVVERGRALAECIQTIEKQMLSLDPGGPS